MILYTYLLTALLLNLILSNCVIKLVIDRLKGGQLPWLIWVRIDLIFEIQVKLHPDIH